MTAGTLNAKIEKLALCKADAHIRRMDAAITKVANETASLPANHGYCGVTFRAVLARWATINQGHRGQEPPMPTSTELVDYTVAKSSTKCCPSCRWSRNSLPWRTNNGAPAT